MVEVLLEKRTGEVKGCACINGSKQQLWIDKDEISSPTAIPESVLLLAVLNAKEGKCTKMADVPNAFIQADYEPKPGASRTVIKLKGYLVEVLVSIAPKTYQPFVEYEKG